MVKNHIEPKLISKEGGPPPFHPLTKNHFFSSYALYVGSLKDKNRSTRVSNITTSSKRTSGVSKKKDPLSPAGGSRDGHRRGRGSGRGQEEREGGDWRNLPASNLPDDWGREKEVTEEKQTSTGNHHC